MQLLQAQTNVLQARFDYIAAMASYDLALSLDTQYVETFDDPIVRPLNPQALNRSERNRFQKVTPTRKPATQLPRAFRKEDPIEPILEPAPPRRSKRKADIRADRQVTETLLRASRSQEVQPVGESDTAAAAQRSSFRRLTRWPLCGPRSSNAVPD